MSKCIIMKLVGDETIRIMHPVGDSINVCLEKARKDYGDRIIHIKVVDKDKIPKDRYFRDAWEQCDEKDIKEDLDKCRSIHLDILRIERNELLDELDKDVLRAIESGDEARMKALKAHKQKLRDMPADCDMKGCKCPDDIKAIRPSILDE